MVASRRLDALITILECIVSEYVVVPISNSYNSSDPRRLCMARYDQFPYEGLLAQAYNLRLYQSDVHPTQEDCILSSIRYYACANHAFCSTYAQDRVFDEHFYVFNASPVSHVSNYFDLLYNETTVFPLILSINRSSMMSTSSINSYFNRYILQLIKQC